MKRMAAWVLCAVLLAGCGDDIVGSEQDGLVLSLQVTDDEIVPGETTTLVGRLTNTTSEQVVLVFPSGCQITAWVEDPSGDVVYPFNGSLLCPAAVTELELDPGETFEHEFTWDGKDWAPGSADEFPPLPAGTYRAHLRLEGERDGDHVSLRTAEQSILVR